MIVDLEKGVRVHATFSTAQHGAIDANGVFDGYFWDGEEHDRRFHYVRITEGKYEGEIFLVMPTQYEILVDPI